MLCQKHKIWSPVNYVLTSQYKYKILSIKVRLNISTYPGYHFLVLKIFRILLVFWEPHILFLLIVMRPNNTIINVFRLPAHDEAATDNLSTSLIPPSIPPSLLHSLLLLTSRNHNSTLTSYENCYFIFNIWVRFWGSSLLPLIDTFI